jgi:hypothetical protein
MRPRSKTKGGGNGEGAAEVDKLLRELVEKKVGLTEGNEVQEDASS